MDWHLSLLDNLKYLTSYNVKLAVACSGGSDSIFLIYSLSQVVSKNQIIGLIVNHNLQENSKNVAEKTKLYLEKIGIKSEILTWNHEKIITGFEEKARIARHNLFEDFCVKNQINTVFLGHHIDDKIETFLMNAVRGSGVAGACSMRRMQKIGKITYVRPMIYTIEKRQILEFLTENSIPWFEDETNQDTKFQRNRLRKMLKFTQQEKNGIIQTIQNLEKMHDDQVARLEKFIEKNSNFENLKFKISISKILELEQSDFRPLILLIIFEKIYKFTNWEIRQNSIVKLYDWLTSNLAKTTLASCIFEKNGDFLTVKPEYKKLTEVRCYANKMTNWNGLCEIVSCCNCETIPLGKLENKRRKSLQIKEKLLQIAHLPAVICGEKTSVPHLGIFEFDVKIL